MCGIVGLWAPSLRQLRGSLASASAALRHRGPDDHGIWQDDRVGLALAHRRLSIVDLSPAGHQPMRSHCGRWVVVFNGEIYNHLLLRDRLGLMRRAAVAMPGGESQGGASTVDGDTWRGHSDTETLLECVSRWGPDRALEATDGMFAFALWDRRERQLHLARDRMGEKPLYYGWVGQGFAFGSELKALRALPGFDAPIDREALVGFMKTGAVPAPASIHRGISKLPPGTRLVLSEADLARRRLPAPVPYWDLLAAARAGHRDPLSFGSDDEAVDALERVLRGSVGRQLLSDVPLGAFLSGGIDSSTVVALMQSQSPRPVKTFTIGFAEEAYDESRHARRIARHLGTDHADLCVDDRAARDVIPMLPTIYCEPFADSSQIPTYLVSRLARGSVTVSLSGDGGDELFGGYSRYVRAAGMWSTLSRIPAPLRHASARAIRALPASTWDAAYRAVSPLIPAGRRRQAPGERLHRGAGALAAASLEQMYRGMFLEQWPADIVLGAVDDRAARDATGADAGFDTIERMMLHDSLAYLPDVILTKVDRAAMSVGLETRVPMLSRDVVELAWRLPFALKVREGRGKWALRAVLRRYVPDALVDRPKMGFGVPVGSWLRGPLRDWADNLLDPSRLRCEGYLDPEPIARRWREHRSGLCDWGYSLWNALMFQAWLDGQTRRPEE